MHSGNERDCALAGMQYLINTLLSLVNLQLLAYHKNVYLLYDAPFVPESNNLFR